MERHREFPQRGKVTRLPDQQAGARRIFVLYDRAWAETWPHLDDWFKLDAFVIGIAGSGQRAAIA